MEALDILLAIVGVMLAVAVFGALLCVGWYWRVIRKVFKNCDDSNKVRDEGMEIARRSLELAERGVKLQEEANELLREILRKNH